MGMILLVGIALAGLAVIVVLVASALSSSGDAKPAGASASISKGQVGQNPTTVPSTGTSTGPSTGPSVTASPSPTPTGATPGTTTTAGVEATPTGQPTGTGLRRHADRAGFVIDVPEGMKDAGRKGGAVSFTGGDESRYLRVRVLPKPVADVLAGTRDEERKAIVAGTYPDYKLVKMDLVRPAPYPGTDVADWEFTYTEGGRVVHVLSRWVTVPDGKSYVIYWAGPHDSWQEESGPRDMVLGSFKPARADSPGGS